MSGRETNYILSGPVQVDDAYLSCGKAGRDSENKLPFAAALSLDEEGHPLRVKLTPAPALPIKPLPTGRKPTLLQVVQRFLMVWGVLLIRKFLDPLAYTLINLSQRRLESF